MIFISFYLKLSYNLYKNELIKIQKGSKNLFYILICLKCLSYLTINIHYTKISKYPSDLLASQ